MAREKRKASTTGRLPDFLAKRQGQISEHRESCNSTSVEKNVTEKQDGSDELFRDDYCNDARGAVTEKPDLEAYWSAGGSWWDVEVLDSRRHNEYLQVHYTHFSDHFNEWVPVAHLRMRSRPMEYSCDCCGEIEPGMDVSVLTRHPDSRSDLEAWFDAKVTHAEKNPHSTPNSCECSFWVELYEIPDVLPFDWSKRKLLPPYPYAVALKDMTSMREPRSMSFDEIIAASLPDVLISSPRIWAKDGARWYSTVESLRPEPENSDGLDDFASYIEEVLSQPFLRKDKSKPMLVRQPFLRKDKSKPMLERQPFLRKDKSKPMLERQPFLRKDKSKPKPMLVRQPFLRKEKSKPMRVRQPFLRKEKFKPTLLRQPYLPMESKRFKRGATAAAPKTGAKESAFAEYFRSVELAQFDNPPEDIQGSDEEGLLPSWNPFVYIESVAPAPLQDPLEHVWEDMRLALESINKAKGEVAKTVEEFITGKCENGLDHTVTFDHEIGEVCEVCGQVVLEIENIWTRDNAERITTAKEGSTDLDESSTDLDEDNYGSAWDCIGDDKVKHQINIEEASNFQLIPNLVKQMQRHQKQGFQFLWRNLAGQDYNGNPCTPPVEPGGCVLSHAPGTGKTFLVISFLQSYMKKYPNCRPVIVAPKIMLQPWEKEFQKWNVDIPVYNFDGQAAREQGKTLFHKHQEAVGNVHFALPKKPILAVCREAMLVEWLKAPSVLVLSYQTFNSMTNVQGAASRDARMLEIKSILLERPSIVVLDEGHYARNNLSKVKEQLMAMKTPLRVMLSGTLFQNNFEELHTCLNIVRSGFVKTFAKTAGLEFNMQQETEPRSDVEDEPRTSEWKRKAAQAAEAAAKKLFIEEIGNKIDRGQLDNSSPKCWTQGLQLLHRLTSSFVHHYTGGILRDRLPPLREFAIVLQPAGLQEKIITKVTERMLEKNNLERECLLSLVCIHPSLLARNTVGKTLTNLLPRKEMVQATVEDPAVGVKTRFVMNLLGGLQQRQGGEKTLIFCFNLDPLMLLERMLETQFGWVGGQETLRIDGKLNADERQSIIERFNDPQGATRVLLLSTKACREGVTLTGASRVVFMDVVWNPAVLRQAIHRAFRIGQTKVVHVYSLMVAGSPEEGKYRTMVRKDWKSQTIFHALDANHKEMTRSIGFWRLQKQSSKDALLNELERQDAALAQPAFKHVFRHGGLFDDESCADDPDGKRTDATDWLRGIEGDVVPSHSHAMDCDNVVGDGALGLDPIASEKNGRRRSSRIRNL